MKNLLYLFRHGDAAPPGILAGQYDFPLSAAGKAQFRYWRDALAAVPFTAAWSSPLSRALQSAVLLLEDNAGPVREPEVVPECCEISLGLWEGKSREWVKRHYAREWIRRGKDMLRVAPPGGESFEALASRVLPAFNEICGHAAPHRFSVLVAHQAVNRVILFSLPGTGYADMWSIPQPTAALNILEIGAGGKATLVEQRFVPKEVID